MICSFRPTDYAIRRGVLFVFDSHQKSLEQNWIKRRFICLLFFAVFRQLSKFTAIRRALSRVSNFAVIFAPVHPRNRHARAFARCGSLLLLVGLRRQTPNKYSPREHQERRNQMISSKVRVPIGHMLYQKHQAAKR